MKNKKNEMHRKLAMKYIKNFKLNPANNRSNDTKTPTYKFADAELEKANNLVNLSNVTCLCLPAVWLNSTVVYDVDLRKNYNYSVYNQLTLNSCTANAGCFLYKYHVPNFEPSRLFLYYNERVEDGTVSLDDGAQMHDILDCLTNQGICLETSWPYDTSKYATEPTTSCYIEATINKLDSKNTYKLNQNISDLVACLQTKGPFIFGFNVGSTFENETGFTGRLTTKDNAWIGSHAVCCVGYSSKSDMFLVANSWGEEWGIDGYFLMSSSLLLDPDVAFDFYTFV